MSKQQIYILGVSAGTDFVISAGGILIAGMCGSGSTQMPGASVWLLAVVTGATAACRTVQQDVRAKLKDGQ